MRAPPSPRSTERNPSVSPLTLRRKYLPRPGNTKPTAAHPAAKAAAAAPQEKHPPPHQRPQIKTERHSATHRNIKLERFKPGFEQDTERELSIIFCRPQRTYKQDPPFYPWLPPEPYVNFALNFKG